MKKMPASKVDELREVLKGKKEEKKIVPPKPKEEKEEPKTSKEVEELAKKLEVAKESAKSNHDKLVRLMAEFDNYKKRMAREKEEHFRFANEKLVMELLPALDDLDRVFEHSSEEGSANTKALLAGVDLVRKALLNALKKFGLMEIKVDGATFDPQVHEALSCIENEDCEDNSVLAVHRKGYKLGDRVIRAAQVTVAKKRN